MQGKERKTLNTPLPPRPPMERWPALIFLVFLHMFLSPAWFYMFFFNSAKYRHCSFNFRTIFVLQQVSCYNYLYLNNIQSQKVKPCGRTTLFSAGLQCQIHKGRQTVLDGGGVFRVSRKEPCQQPMSSINLEWSR
jgi:hypothetical protein